jgi:hypothetical protein
MLTRPPAQPCSRSRLQFSARPSEEMIRKSTPPATASNRNPEAECGEIYVEFMAENNMGIKDIKKFVQTVSAGTSAPVLWLPSAPCPLGAQGRRRHLRLHPGRVLPARGPAGQHHPPRPRAHPRRPQQGGEGRPAQEVPPEGDPAAAYPAQGPHRAVLRAEEGPGRQDHPVE